MASSERFNELQEELWEILSRHTAVMSKYIQDICSNREPLRTDAKHGMDVLQQLEEKLQELILFADTEVEWSSDEEYDQFRNNIVGILTEIESSKIRYTEEFADKRIRRN